MHRFLSSALVALLLFSLPACGPDESAGVEGDAAEPGELVVYAGRRQALVEAAIDRFREDTGIDVQARFGNDAELLAALEEEGDRSEADLFWANTSGALGAAANAGLLTPLPDSILQMPEAFVPQSGLWVPVTVRFRVLAYDPADVDDAALPSSVLDLPQRTDLRGRIGWTPTYSSFQDFVTALTIEEGEDATRAWLEGMQELEPKAYGSNTPMLEALAAGEIDVALTNHYYALRMLQGEGVSDGEPPVALHRFAPGDVGNLALVTGAGMLETATNRENAARFLSYLLSEEAQAYAAETVYEYPVIRGVDLPDYFLPFDEAIGLSPDLDFGALRDMEGTLQLLREEELL
jgi:iron(III) transport system substrate-binding protein